MKEKPRGLRYFSLFFVLFSLVSVVELFFSWKLQVHNCFQFYSIAFLGCGISGLLSSWRVSSHIFLIFGAMWIYDLCAYSYLQQSPVLEKYQVFAFVLFTIFLVAQTLWLCAAYLKVFLNPESHWWKTPRRIPLELKAIARTSSGKSFVAEIKNISNRGLLLNLKSKENLEMLEQGEFMNIHFMLDYDRSIRLSAIIVRKEAEHLGLSISQMDSYSKFQVEKFIRHQSNALKS